MFYVSSLIGILLFYDLLSPAFLGFDYKSELFG